MKFHLTQKDNHIGQYSFNFKLRASSGQSQGLISYVFPSERSKLKAHEDTQTKYFPSNTSNCHTETNIKEKEMQSRFAQMGREWSCPIPGNIPFRILQYCTGSMTRYTHDVKVHLAQACFFPTATRLQSFCVSHCWPDTLEGNRSQKSSR